MRLTKLQIAFAFAFAFAGLLVFTGCATPGTQGQAHAHAFGSHRRHIQSGSITNFTAYCASNTVEVGYWLRDRSVLAHATWTLTDGANGGTNYQCRFSVLTFDKQRRATRKSVVSPKNKLMIRDAAQWKELLQGVFTSLAPAKPGHGVLLLAQDMEIVVFRNTGGELKVVDLQEKPPDIVVDQTFSDADFSREAVKLLTARVSAIDPNQYQFLFVTGDEPDFVLVDIRTHLVVFLSYPGDPEAKPVSGLFALRVADSLLIKSLLITAIKNPVSLIGRGLWHLGSSGITMLNSLSVTSSDPPPPPVYTGPPMDMAAWERKLDDIVTARRHQGRLQLFVDGSEFFPALVQSIETAKQSVDVMVYIFGTDNYAVTIADVLKQRSKSVRVRVLMDDIGSLFAEGAPALDVPPDFQPPGDIQSYLASSAHVHVRADADPWLATDHRKCFIIDGWQAYLGGMNIGWLYRYEWHDLMVGLTGPVVGQLEKDYEKAWALEGPGGDFAYARAAIFDRRHFHRNPLPGSIDIRVLHTATAEMQIYHAQLAAIRRAKRYIYVENAYFNDSTILRALIQARQRGVDVRVIVPSESDVGIMQVSDSVVANEMIRSGIRVYVFPGMTHVKAAIYDGWACVGSANLEKMSLRVSQELDVAYSDPDAVAELDRRLFEPDFKRSRELKSPAELNWTDPFLKAIAEQL